MLYQGKLRKFFNNLYLLRVEIALWLFIALLAPLARHTSLFEGLLVYEHGEQVEWTSFTAFVAAAVLMVFTNLVLFYGSIRLYGSKTPLDPKPLPDNRRTIVVFFICLVPPCILVACTDVYTLSQQSGHALTPAGVFWSMAAGFGWAVVAVIGAKFLQVLFATPLPGQAAEPHFIVPLGWLPVLGPWFEDLYERPGWLSRLGQKPGFHGIERLETKLRNSFAMRFGEGYFDFTEDARAGHILPGQGFVFCLAIVVFLIYETSGLGYLGRLKCATLSCQQSNVPTIAHVLVAFLLLATLLSGLAFFLDRYRIPLTLFIVVLLLLTSIPDTITGHDSDHEFDLARGIQDDAQARPLTPTEAILSRKSKRLIAVAAAGGGIQAGAWTTKVLSELRDAHKTAGEDFAGAVTVMSGVSGGSVGILNYLTTYGVPGHGWKSTADALAAAEHDSLQAISWGLVHPDFWRVVFPFAISTRHDRGWALERMVAQASDTDGLLLSQLTQHTGELPAVLFNSTEAETGAPVVFPSTTFPSPDVAAGIDNFRRVYGEYADIPVSTAVRLSATFPWVSPAARSAFEPSPEPPFQKPADLHYVDGGYYDTFGMVSLVAWLREALTDKTTHSAGSVDNVNPELAKTQVLVLEINSFPPPGPPKAPSQPWPYQLIAPVLALYDVRDHSQQARNQFEYEVQSQTKLFQNVFDVEFQYNPAASECRGGAPLSWHLSPRERYCIDSAWTDSQGSDLANAKACITAFLDGAPNIATKCRITTHPAPPAYNGTEAP